MVERTQFSPRSCPARLQNHTCKNKSERVNLLKHHNPTTTKQGTVNSFRSIYFLQNSKRQKLTFPFTPISEAWGWGGCVVWSRNKRTGRDMVEPTPPSPLQALLLCLKTSPSGFSLLLLCVHTTHPGVLRNSKGNCYQLLWFPWVEDCTGDFWCLL